jgi:hypothetical protein
MKPLPSIQTQSRNSPVSAFTLVEMIMAMFIFVVFLVAGMVTVQIFALRINNLTTDKLMAAGGCSKSIDQICDQIRGAQFLWVGTFSNNVFTSIANGSSQQGTALQVFSTTNATPYTIYYLNSTTTNLYAITNGQTATSTNPGTILASRITNNPCFWSENFHGTINTSTNTFVNGENCTIRMVWDFCRYAADSTNIAHEFYTFMARASPRAPNY